MNSTSGDSSRTSWFLTHFILGVAIVLGGVLATTWFYSNNGSRERTKNRKQDASGVPARTETRDTARTNAPTPKPRDVISQPHGRDHIVTTVKIPVADGLRLTIVFLVLAQSAGQDAEILNGLVGTVFLDNLTSTHDHSLAGTTMFAIRRGDRRFSFYRPRVKQINAFVTSLVYGAFSPERLHDFLAGDEKSATVIELDGSAYRLEPEWNQHLHRLVREVDRQIALKRSSNSGPNTSTRSAKRQSPFERYLEIVSEILKNASEEDRRAYVVAKLAYDRAPTPGNGQAMRRAIEHAVVNASSELRRKYEQAKSEWLANSE